jgi:predicted enzyme related to lactoylglutathione lyase
MINSFIHVNIYSDNPAVVVEFYNGKLDIPLLFEGFGDYEGACFGFIKDAPNICVWHKKRPIDISSPVIVLGSDGLDEVYKDLLAKGVGLTPPVMASWGGRELIFNDPEVNVIMVLE